LACSRPSRRRRVGGGVHGRPRRGPTAGGEVEGWEGGAEEGRRAEVGEGVPEEGQCRERVPEEGG